MRTHDCCKISKTLEFVKSSTNASIWILFVKRWHKVNVIPNVYTSSIGWIQNCSDQRAVTWESALKYVKEMKKKVIKLHNERML